jgi:hypothetical protein
MSSTTGDGDLEQGGAPERIDGVAEAVPATPVWVQTVYDDIRVLLMDRGWVQGRPTQGERLSLTAAIDQVVGVDVETGAGTGSRLGRSGRVRRHLRELAGVANLIEWNDDRARNMSDVIDLLKFAAVAYPDD